MSAAEGAVFATIAGAVVCWAAGEALQSRAAWALGALLALLHALLAFLVFYGWSHEVARVSTMRQTEALTGIRFGGGIYVNYLFLVVWLADAAWWWVSPRSRAARSRAVALAVHGFIFFIMVNGAVVFADGLARLLGGAAVSVVAVAWLRRFSR
jgi:hypothetical protein